MKCAAPKKSCAPSSRSLATLDAIVDDYIASRRTCGKLVHYANQPSPERALEEVASWRDENKKVLAHQRRVSRAAKAGAGERIRQLKLAGVRDFEDLHRRVDKAIGSIRGIGALAVYDAALHIGAYLRNLPDRVYLHCRTRDGARALGLDASQHSLPPEAFPAEFQRLEPWEIEDVLCIYQPDIERIVGRRKAA
jgi:hypothetical protein